MTPAVEATRARVRTLLAEAGLAASDALCEAVAGAHLSIGKFLVLPDDDGMFGRLQLVPTGEGRCRVVLSHTMLGEGLAEAQLLPILATVADTAQELARHLPARFSASRAD
jgi:hypothetical protein